MLLKIYVKNSQDSSGWLEVEYPDNFMSLNNTGITIEDVLPLLATDNVVRLVAYYGSATELDTVYLEGLSQNGGLSINVYADDVAHPALPTTLVTSHSQNAQSQRRRTANEMLSFTAVSKTAFMVEISGLVSSDGPYPSNVLQGALGDASRALSLGVIAKPTLMSLDLSWQVQPKSGSGFDPDVGTLNIEVLNGITSEVVYSETLNGDVTNGVMHHSVSFWVDTTMNHPDPAAVPQNSQLFLNLAIQGSGMPENPPLVLSCELKSFANRNKFSIEGLFLGVDAIQFDEGHNWGAEYLDFNEIEFQQSNSQCFFSKGYVPRSRALIFDAESTSVLAELRDLMFELNNGFCLLDEISTSDDPFTKILGSVKVVDLSPTNVNRHKFGAKMTERKEWH